MVRREVSSKISEQIEKVINCKKQFLKEISVLESDIPKKELALLYSLEDESLKEIGINRWDDYIEDANIMVLSPNDICNEELLSLYFSGKYPFSAGKKKDEFPDAISMLSLKSWVENEDEKVYVISGDSDLKGFCENDARYIGMRQLTEFLDIYNTDKERLASVVHEYVNNEIEWVKSTIENTFLNCGFDYSDNWEAEVDNIEVQSIEIINVDVIEVEIGKADINLSVNIDFTANIRGPNHDNSIWDSEDKRYIFIEYFNTDMYFDEVYNVSMTVYFDEEIGGFTKEDENIQFDGSDTITLNYQEDY